MCLRHSVDSLPKLQNTGKERSDCMRGELNRACESNVLYCTCFLKVADACEHTENIVSIHRSLHCAGEPQCREAVVCVCVCLDDVHFQAEFALSSKPDLK